MFLGYCSYQMGLDVDIWMWFVVNLQLLVKLCESILLFFMCCVVGVYVNEGWSCVQYEIIKVVVQDFCIVWIFVFSGVKVWMCDDEKGDKFWLYKVWLWWGYYYYFYVWLNCFEGLSGCVEQDDLFKGDGCQDVCDWVVDILNLLLLDLNVFKFKLCKELVLVDLLN